MNSVQKIIDVLIPTAFMTVPLFVLFDVCGLTEGAALIACAGCIMFVTASLAIIYDGICYIIDKYITSNLNRR